MRQVHHWTAVIFVGRHRRPPRARVLHRGLPAAARAELAAGVRAAAVRDRGGHHRLLAAGRPAVGDGRPDRLLGDARRSRSSGRTSRRWPSAGEFPTPGFSARFFVLHVMLLPGLFIGPDRRPRRARVPPEAHPVPGPAERERTTSSGRQFWPGQAFLSGGLFFLTAAVMALMGGLVQINPVWSYGPFEPSVVSSPAQPDWYVGWLDGALRIWPPFEPDDPGHHDPVGRSCRASSCRACCSRSWRSGRGSTAS